MTIGSGISAQLGFADEGINYGIVVTPDHFADFDDESLAYDPTWLESMGLRAGRTIKPANKALISRHQGTGTIKLPFAYKGLGLLLRAALGSSPTATLISGSAYNQVHQLGDPTAKSLTVQVGRPQTDGTVKPFTFPGCVSTGFELTVADNDLCRLSVDIDAKDETTATALAAAAYPSTTTDGQFAFRDIGANGGPGLKFGGAAATTSGVVAITGGVAATTLFKTFSLKGTNGLANDRFGLGNAGAKSRPILNALQTVTLSLGGEFTNQAELYDVYKAQTTIAFQMQLTGALIAGSNYNALDIVIPALKIKKAAPVVSGTDIVQQTVEAEVYSDGTNNPLQITLTNTDTAI